MLRRYQITAGRAGDSDAVEVTAAWAKPPGNTLRGSALELVLVLEQLPGGPERAGVAGRALGGQPAPSTAEEVVGWMEELLSMLRALSPPVRLLLRLKSVLLQASDGA